MRPLYFVLTALMILLGLVHVAATFLSFDALTGRAAWFASGGLAIVLTGQLNLLNLFYGAEARGVRWGTVGANGAMTVFAALAGLAGAAPVAQILFIVGLMLAATILSIRPPAPRARVLDR